MIYKLTSLAIGTALIVLAFIWGQDLDACPGLLLVGGLMILLGSTKQEIINRERKYENRNQLSGKN